MAAENRKKLSAFDIALLIVVAAATCVLLYFLFFADAKGTKASAKDVNTEYELRISGINVMYYDVALSNDSDIPELSFLSVNDKLYLGDTTEGIGTISSIRWEPFEASTGIADETGALIRSEYPGYIDLILTVRVHADLEKDGRRVGDAALRVNEELDVRTSAYAAHAVVESVRDAGGEG